MLDRFDFEEHLMKCWHITDDIRTIIRTVDNKVINAEEKDELLNMLVGVEALYNERFRQLMDNFNTLIENGKIL
jgi:hypothetical protein